MSATSAPAAHQRRLLDVQALDTRLAQIAHRARSLPEHAAIAELDHAVSLGILNPIGKNGRAVRASDRAGK